MYAYARTPIYIRIRMCTHARVRAGALLRAPCYLGALGCSLGLKRVHMRACARVRSEALRNLKEAPRNPQELLRSPEEVLRNH